MALVDPNEQVESPDGAVPADRAPRVSASQIGASTQARLLPGGDAEVINISNTGMRIEGKNRLVVGSIVSVRVRGAAIKRFDGRIVRSHVSTIHRDGTLSYESAIEFDRQYPVTDPVSPDQEGAVRDVPADGAVEQQGSEEDVYVLDSDNDW